MFVTVEVKTHCVVAYRDPSDTVINVSTINGIGARAQGPTEIIQIPLFALLVSLTKSILSPTASVTLSIVVIPIREVIPGTVLTARTTPAFIKAPLLSSSGRTCGV